MTVHKTVVRGRAAPIAVEVAGTAHSSSEKGREPIGAYWKMALERLPDLRFELLEVFAGVDSLVIFFQAMPGKRSVEVLFFNESGKVYQAMAHYELS